MLTLSKQISVDEIKFALKCLKKYGCPDVSILHCILNYPTKNINANLNMIEDLKESFPNYIIGYSDHTKPDDNMNTLIVADIKGAKIIEKHFTDNKLKKGNDHYHSMDKNDLKIFFKNLKKIRNLLGKKIKQPIKSEDISRKNARRSIVLDKHLIKGEKLTEKKILTKRPGSGISPIHWNKVLGKRVNKNLSKDHIIQWKDLK